METAQQQSAKLKISRWYPLLRRYRKFQLSLSPQQNLLMGFFSYTIIGWLLLCMPWFHKQPASALDSLFTATSAISTTGLVTVSVFDTYNFAGQFIVMLIFQVGGIGYMTFTSFILLSKNSNLTHWHQRVLNAEFSLPRGFNIQDFLRSVIIFTLLIESIGAACLFMAFIDAGVEHNFAIWSSLYHSVSAFCTAGFGLYNDSFEQFAGHTGINLILSCLSICGSLGFIVVTDLWNRITRNPHSITYTTKIIFLVIVVMLIAGTLMIFFFEPSIASMHLKERLLASFFQAMTACTTVGFNTVSIGNISLSVMLVVVILMYVGASPSGTGGGMKSTTFVALIAIMWSRVRGKERVALMGKTIPLERMYVATSTFILYASVIFIATLVLSFTESFSLDHILFEVTSAIGTVGLSTGITGNLSSAGKIVIILTMFIGRMGVVTFGLAILARKKHTLIREAAADLAV